MTATVTESANATNITSTTTIFTGAGSLLGIFCSSVSGGSIKVADGATTKVNTFTPVAALWYPLPFRFNTSLVITIGGTVDCTVSWGA